MVAYITQGRHRGLIWARTHGCQITSQTFYPLRHAVYEATMSNIEIRFTKERSSVSKPVPAPVWVKGCLDGLGVEDDNVIELSNLVVTGVTDVSIP